jgi:hypothetical protein
VVEATKSLVGYVVIGRISMERGGGAGVGDGRIRLGACGMSRAACRGDRDGWGDGVCGAALSSTVAASVTGMDECPHRVAAVRSRVAAVTRMVAAVSGMVARVDGMVTSAPR